MNGPGLLGGGAAQTYGYPMVRGLLGALNNPPFGGAGATQGLLGAMGAPPNLGTNWTQVAFGMAGNPHAGPYAASDGAIPGATMGALGAGTATPGQSSPSTGSQALGLLGSLAQNPSVLKDGVNAVEGLLGGSPAASALLSAPQQAALSSAFGAAPVAGSLADAMGMGAGTLAPLAASQLAPIAVGPVASGVGTMAPIALGGAPAAAAAAAPAAASTASASTAAGAGLGAGAGAAAALGVAAVPLLAAALVPQQLTLTPSDVSNLENTLSSATKANGGAITQFNSSTPQNVLDAYSTLMFDNPSEFSTAGGYAPVSQFLQGLGYNPVNWGGVQAAPAPRVSPAARRSF